MQTLCDILDRIRRDDRAELLYVCDEEQVRSWSAAELLAAVDDCAAALAAHGVGRGDRVGIISGNRPEWHVIDFGCQRLGAIPVPLFESLTAPEVAFCFGDSGCVAAMVDSPEQLAKVCAAASNLPDLRLLIVLEPPTALPPRPDRLQVVSMTELREGAAVAGGQEPQGPAGPDSVATIIYTSGTTGQPKGVMLTHANFAANLVGLRERIPPTPEDIGLSLLPLSHSFQRTVDYSMLWGGARIAYTSPARASADMRRVRPTIMVGVPRLYQKIRSAIEARVEESKPIARRLFYRALAVGRRRAEARLGGPDDGLLNRFAYAVLDRLVLAKIRAVTGGRLRHLSSGGAALDPELNWWYLALGWELGQGYGLTESAPIIATNAPEDNRVGSVGRPLVNVEVRIDGDGEVLARGPNLMKGYWNRPDATATAIVDGWLHTGDVGRLDADGYLYITDRKKSLLVTSTGKKVAPQPLENRLLRSPWIEQIMVLGDDRRFVAALIVPVPERVARWARERGRSGDPASLVDDPELRAEIEAELERLQTDFAPYERVRGFRLLPAPFTVEGGHLTPTLKIVRRNVERDFADSIEEIYAD